MDGGKKCSSHSQREQQEHGGWTLLTAPFGWLVAAEKNTHLMAKQKAKCASRPQPAAVNDFTRRGRMEVSGRDEMTFKSRSAASLMDAVGFGRTFINFSKLFFFSCRSYKNDWPEETLYPVQTFHLLDGPWVDGVVVHHLPTTFGLCCVVLCVWSSVGSKRKHLAFLGNYTPHFHVTTWWTAGMSRSFWLSLARSLLPCQESSSVSHLQHLEPFCHRWLQSSSRFLLWGGAACTVCRDHHLKNGWMSLVGFPSG